MFRVPVFEKIGTNSPTINGDSNPRGCQSAPALREGWRVHRNPGSTGNRPYRSIERSESCFGQLASKSLEEIIPVFKPAIRSSENSLWYSILGHLF